LRSSFIGNRSSFVSNRSSFVSNRSPFVSNRSPFISNRSSFVGNRSPFVSNRSPFVSNRSSFVVIDHRLSIILGHLNSLSINFSCYTPQPLKGPSARHWLCKVDVIFVFPTLCCKFIFPQSFGWPIQNVLKPFSNNGCRTLDYLTEFRWMQFDIANIFPSIFIILAKFDLNCIHVVRFYSLFVIIIILFPLYLDCEFLTAPSLHSSDAESYLVLLCAS